MSQRVPPLNVALLAVPEATGSTLYGMYDLFTSAGRDWALLIGGVWRQSRGCDHR